MTQSDMKISMLRGTPAVEVLYDPLFVEEWEHLRQVCPWSTVFQGQRFTTLWYDCYGEDFEPLIVTGRRNGYVAGLLLLAVSRRNGGLEFAGERHCEYKVWLALPEENDAFIDKALRQLAGEFPAGTLAMFYLPPGAPTEWTQLPFWQKRCFLRTVPWGQIRLPDFKMEQSPAYRKYRQRIRKLEKLGIEIQKWTGPDNLRSELERVYELCDFRAAALWGIQPFADHPRKTEFYLRLLAEPGLVHATALRVNGQMVSLEISFIDGSSVVHGLLGHAPEYSRYSVGRFHLLRLCQELAAEGFEGLDLTPDGEYKDDFATESGSASVLHVHFSRLSAERMRAEIAARRWTKRRFPKLKSYVTQLRGFASRLGQARWSQIFRILWALVTRRVWGQREIRVYAMHSVQTERPAETRFTIACNRLVDLCLYEPTSFSSPLRRAFLQDALRRIEEGGLVYTIVEDGKLVHYGWVSMKPVMSFPEVGWPKHEVPPDSAVLWDFFTHPDYRGRGYYQASLRRMICDLAAPDGSKKLYIAVLADNLSSRHCIEKVGFQYEGSFFCESRLFRVRRWSTMANASGPAKGDCVENPPDDSTRKHLRGLLR